MSNRLFEIQDSGESYWYSALSPEQAVEYHEDRVSNVYGEDIEEIDSIVAVPDEKEIAFTDAFDECAPQMTMTAKEWASRKAGFVATSSW